MTKPLTVSISHRLSQEEATTRIRNGVANYRQQYAGKFASVEEKWTDRRMDFKLGVMGQSVTGRVEVQPQTVELTIELPWILAAFAEKIRGQLQREGQKLLGP